MVSDPRIVTEVPRRTQGLWWGPAHCNWRPEEDPRFMVWDVRALKFGRKHGPQHGCRKLSRKPGSHCRPSPVTRLSQTSYRLHILWHWGGTAMRLVKSKVFMMPPFCFCPRSLDMEDSFRCPFLLHRGPGFFDCVLRGQNGILSCLLCYNLLGLMFRASHVLLWWWSG